MDENSDPEPSEIDQEQDNVDKGPTEHNGEVSEHTAQNAEDIGNDFDIQIDPPVAASNAVVDDKTKKARDGAIKSTRRKVRKQRGDSGDTDSEVTTGDTRNEVIAPIEQKLKTPLIYISTGGDMANRFGYHAFAYAAKLWIQDHYPGVTPAFLHRGSARTRTGSLYGCMPNARDVPMDNDPVITDTVRAHQIAELETLGLNMKAMELSGRRHWTWPVFEDNLKLFMDTYLNRTSHDSSIDQATAKSETPGLKAPFLPVRSMATSIPQLFDEYLDHFREYFRWDDTSLDCCVQKPAPDESVFVSYKPAIFS